MRHVNWAVLITWTMIPVLSGLFWLALSLTVFPWVRRVAEITAEVLR